MEHDGVSYVVEVPTLHTREDWRAAMIEYGCTYPSDIEMTRTLSEGIRQEVAEDEQDKLLEIVARFNQLGPEDLKDDENAGLIEDMEVITGFVRENYHRFAQKEAARSRYISYIPIVAFERFVKDWRGLDVDYVSVGDKIDSECLNNVPREAIAEIGWRIFGLIEPVRDDQKKARSRSRSRSIRNPTTVDPDHQTEGKAGKSPEKSTRQIQDSH